MTLVTSDDPERRLAEALRAQAVGVQRPGQPVAPRPPVAGLGHMPTVNRRVPAPEPGTSVRTALLLALLVGALIGAMLGLMSLWLPGMLPPIG